MCDARGLGAVRVALYARVSTDDKGQNPETQLIALRAAVTQRGWEYAGEYVDLGWSGAKDRRPQLDRLMADAAKKRFDVVMVWRYDRFARSTVHLIKALETFQGFGINFVSLTESIDTSSPMGRFIFTIFAGLAELERQIIRERVRAGVARARAEGKKMGRPTVLVDKSQICERVRAGEPIAKIARETGIARSTVRAIVASNGVEKAEVRGGESLGSAVL